MTEQERQRFYNECVKVGTGWSEYCSATYRENADQVWLQDYILQIFQSSVPDQNLSNPVSNKLVAITPDCLSEPLGCQTALNWACANSSAEAYNTNSGYQSGIANVLCGCFALPSQRSWLTNCYCQGSVANLSQPLCLANICQIDNVALTLMNSRAGDITLQQACGGYNLQARSNCTIENINIYVEDSSIGSVLLQQQCLTTVPTRVSLMGEPVDFFDGTGDILETENDVTRPTWLIVILVLILVVFVILSILCIILFINSIPTYRLVIESFSPQQI